MKQAWPPEAQHEEVRALRAHLEALSNADAPALRAAARDYACLAKARLSELGAASYLKEPPRAVRPAPRAVHTHTHTHTHAHTHTHTHTHTARP
jgi:hypothetical protein